MENEEVPTEQESETATTTHAAWGAGEPHLIVKNGDERFTHHLTGEQTRIGSGPDTDLTVEGTDSTHATIVHDERDEFILTLHGEGEMNANPRASGTHDGERSETLRTGARFTAGEWEFVFYRAEFADHGRPYGGREGGELSVQPPQPARPDYANDPDAAGSRDGQERNDWHPTDS